MENTKDALDQYNDYMEQIYGLIHYLKDTGEEVWNTDPQTAINFTQLIIDTFKPLNHYEMEADYMIIIAHLMVIWPKPEIHSLICAQDPKITRRLFLTFDVWMDTYRTVPTELTETDQFFMDNWEQLNSQKGLIDSILTLSL